jgi:2-amino-4-hydroxy-6-hydroxymethyldihydropteridine diphosphokinase
VDIDVTIAYLSLGSNLGDRAGNLLLAVRGLLEAGFHVNRLSAVYETEPVEIESELTYLNMAAEVHVTSISPEQMLARMLRIEYLLGRRNKFLNAPRTADLDLLLYGDKQQETDFLTLPHPRLHLRKFVLVPMNEIAPHVKHPGLGKSMQELLAESKDTARVERWNPNLNLLAASK